MVFLFDKSERGIAMRTRWEYEIDGYHIEFSVDYFKRIVTFSYRKAGSDGPVLIERFPYIDAVCGQFVWDPVHKKFRIAEKKKSGSMKLVRRESCSA